jgi:hypothetical protein
MQYKNQALAFAAGAAAFYVANFAEGKVEALRDPKQWWATPIALGAGGYFAATRKSGTMQNVGCALLGAAGALGAFKFSTRPAATTNPNSPPAQGLASDPYFSAGMLVPNAGMVVGDLDQAFSALDDGIQTPVLTAGAISGGDWTNAGELVNEAEAMGLEG